jgi:hypothetical protein
MGHDRRAKHVARHPVLVTLRATAGVPSCRSPGLFTVIRDSIAQSTKPAFRVLHFSVQQDHLHAIVEGDSHEALTRGIRGLTIRIALAVKRVAGIGKLWGDRCHTRDLETPREVRNAIVYVLLNFRKHLRAPEGIDPRSSGPWFDGWARPPRRPSDPCPTAEPQTWLAAKGWRRRGLIDVHEAPKPTAKFSR